MSRNPHAQGPPPAASAPRAAHSAPPPEPPSPRPGPAAPAGDREPGPDPAPDPAPDHAPDLGPARRRVLAAVAAAGSPGVTIAALARGLGGHANTVRHHLAGLVAAGLVAEETAPPSGRGRPARLFRATPAGSGPTAGTEAVGYRELAGALVAVAADRPGLAGDAGRHWGGQVAARYPAPDAGGSPAAVRQALAGILDAQGFGATQAADGGLELRTCPLVGEAREHPGAVCGIHAAMLQGVLDAWGVRGDAVLEPFALPHACRVVVRHP